MNVLLLRPAPRNERFGLGPFFRIEPLGLEYIAAALEQRGHRAAIADCRFGPSLRRLIDRHRPGLIGIAAMHALETEDVLELAAQARTLAPATTIIVGGHTAAAFPDPFMRPPIDAVVLDDGERAVPRLASELAAGRSLTDVPGVACRAGGSVTRSAPDAVPFDLDEVRLPARHLVANWRHHYACLAHRPVWLVETARGCPFRCSFCSIWQLHARSVRERAIDAVADDLQQVGDHVFIADDLFWYHPSRSLELAAELKRRGVKKQWILVQSRVDLVARHPHLLEAWRSLATEFDIFFGLEAATNEGLSALSKDATVSHTVDGIAVARHYSYGVTGNFVVDPSWGENDFRRLWDFVDEHQLHQAGFTILTPLPGTGYFDQIRHRLGDRPWAHFDMHHLLWPPALGPERFFELYCETWRRSVLNLRGRKSLWQWLRECELRNMPFLLGALRRTQTLMDPAHYLAEYDRGMEREDCRSA